MNAQKMPKLLSDRQVNSSNYLPDFSYAGYHYSEQDIPTKSCDKILNVTDYGAIPNDGLDDTRAVQKALKEAHEIVGSVEIQFPQGRFILSDILYLRRSHIRLRGAGSGSLGTTLYFPRPMRYFEDPPALQELREYLVELDKRQREPQNNLDLPFSQYAWSGGMIWTQVPGTRVKTYLDKYDTETETLAELNSGKRGEHVIILKSKGNIKVGDVVQIEWYNKEGEKGSLLSSLYDNAEVKIGSHHWNYPNHAIVQQQTLIIKVDGNKVTIKDPLLHDIRPEWKSAMVYWPHLEEVGIEHFNIEFPVAPNIAHHVEDGYNAIYLTNLYNGWVRDVRIKNADSGILTEQTSNVTIENIVTEGEKIAHYSVSMGSVHNILVQHLTIYNQVRHPLSFNTHATKSVYTRCRVFQDPILDQHSGANHQNLFDNIGVMVDLPEDKLEYPLFAGGGAGYWKPSHGAFTTFWNIDVTFKNGFDRNKPVLLNGMKNGPSARLIGVHGNLPIEISYEPNAYVEWDNEEMISVPSLFTYQLSKRLK